MEETENIVGERKICELKKSSAEFVLPGRQSIVLPEQIKTKKPFQLPFKSLFQLFVKCWIPIAVKEYR